MAQLMAFTSMKTYKNLYSKIISLGNLELAYKKARIGKTLKNYVLEFEKNLEINLTILREELLSEIYKPLPLKTFILRDPKTRVISKSHFRDRVVHHAIVNILEPIFDKTFIYDSCANRKGKGTLFPIKRFDKFIRKVSKNGKINGQFTNNQIKGYCLKADIRHYFNEVDQEILIQIINKKIKDNKVIILIKKILENGLINEKQKKIGMPLGNLTSQFFANVYLNELDYFVKHNLRSKYYIRYVDDFVILNESIEQLEKWKIEIGKFLKGKLKIQLHQDKSKTISLSKGVDFVGFRNFYHFKLLRKRNIRKIQNKILSFEYDKITLKRLSETLQGWQAYAKWANTYKLRKQIKHSIIKIIMKKSQI